MDINWKELTAVLIGNGILIALVGFLVQYLINRQNIKLEERMHRQNARLEERMHNQNIKLEERKRADYFVSHNYLRFFEFAFKANQVLLHWYVVADRAEKGKHSEHPKMWKEPVTVQCSDNPETTSMAHLFQVYDLIFPDDVADLCLDATKKFDERKYEEVKSKTIKATLLLRRQLGINTSRDEIKKRLELIGNSNS